MKQVHPLDARLREDDRESCESVRTGVRLRRTGGWGCPRVSSIIWAMKVSELGEFGLIGLLARIVPQGGPEHRMLLGIGDDAAAWQGDDSTVLATTDAMVEGVHFTGGTPWWQLGWKALAVNLSDIAAMGGVPTHALVNLSLPGDTEVEDVKQLYRGLADLAGRHQVAIVGGNITRAPLIMITVTVIGRGLVEGLLMRSRAVPGDLVAVTGYLGAAAAGLRALSEKIDVSPQAAAYLNKARLQPQPRIAEGQLMVKLGVRAAIDVSDGLLADLGHVCKASNVGATVRAEAVPVHPLVEGVFRNDARRLALTGGEDYELLFTASQRVMEEVRAALGAECPVTVIGEITHGTGVVLLGEDGKPYHIDGPGWDHFRKGG
ncbi:MAG: thiamine-phosphate kinase [Dehalococcoidia bacterium]|nr:thiamine-phosphate kinase [Dehalococcoidia bacterium]